MTNSTRCALLAKQACTTLSHVVQKITPPSANNFLKLFFALFAMLALGVGNAWGADVESYSATFTSVTTHSYTQNKTFTLNEKSWTASVSQVNSSVFYLGCNNTHASKGILANNSTFSEIVTALKSVDTKYSSTSNAHAYALLFDNAYDNVTKVNFAWSGGNNAFQVYLFGYTNSTWVLLGSTNYATSGTNTAGSVEWTGTAANYAKFAVVARPGTTSSTATNKTLRAKSFKIYTDDTPVGATKYAVTIDRYIEHGTVTADVAEAAEGATVTLTATPNAGYNFGAWDVMDASSNAVTVTDNKFTMPASNVTVSASFVAKTQYSVAWKVNSEDADGGSTSATEGDKVAALPNTPDDCSGDVVFVGWSNQEVSDGNKPALLFTDLAGSPEITGNTTFYAVFAKRTITTGGTPENVTVTKNFADFSVGTQYATETYELSTGVTITIYECHMNEELRIYSSSTHDGYVVSNELPGVIKSIDFNAGNKVDAIVVSGSTDGSTWTTVGEVSITSTSYNDYSLDFGETNYTYFKLDVKGANQVRLKSLTLTYQSGNGTSVDYSDYSTSCTVEQDYTITIADDIEHGTITAPATAKAGATITLTATADENYSFDTWSVTEEGGTAVTVSNNQFTMPESNVTVSATFVENPKWTITWKSVEGSTTTEVYQGKSLGTIDEANDCPDKVFMGWTAANEVNPNGLDITYAKEIDIPTDHTTYNAVYAAEGDVADIVDELTQAWTSISGTSYSSWSDKKSKSPAFYAGNSAGGNNSIQLRSNNSNSGIVTTTSGGKAKKIVVTWFTGDGGTSSGRTLNVYGKNSAYSAATDLYDNSKKGTLIGTIVCGTSTELEITDEYEYIGLCSNSGAMYLSEIKITWSSTSYSHYSFDCEVVNDPYLNVDPTTITFDATNVGFNSTKTIDITAGYLTEDITLAISGEDANEFSVSTEKITKDEEVSQEVTVTYDPTAEGNHTATLTITSGTLSKTVALSGSAEVATIYTLTNLADINPNDRVIIVGNVSGETYAMSNAQGTTAAPTAVAVTVVDDKIATNETTILWNISKSGDNLTIYPNGEDTKWLYTTDDNNGVRVGDNENKTFTIADGYLKNTSTNRYVGIYNKQNWRCYTSTTTNIAGQTFAFYVLPDTDPSISVNTTSKDFGAVINGKSASQEFEITARNIATPAFSTSVTGANATYFTATINANKVIVTYAPTAVGEHVAALTITETTTSKSVEVALTGECVETVNVATAMALEKDEVAYFDEFEVVKVVTGKGNIYIKDASGHGLIYDNTLAGELKDGDRVKGFVGISSPYNGLPEAKPYNVTYADLTITAGTAAEPYDFTSTAIASTDINKYVVFNDVEIATAVSMSKSNKEFSLAINSNNVAFYNQFEIEKTLEAGKTYDIYGFVSIYNEKLQVYFYQALEEDEVVTKYTVTYNAGGATGEVPVDDNEYTEGSQVTLKSALGLTKEGYDYKGWKVTDEGGNEIAVSSNKFNMPASNVTVTAQWEEIVVTPREDFSAGLWVLVTDASELAADDYIIVAAKDYNVAMVSYDYDVRKNNCGQTDITKFGNNNCFLTWKEEIGVFQLANSGSNYTIQDVNTEEYLYAAGGESSNYLKADDEIPADAEAAKPYIWSITIADGVTTVQATSNGRNLLRYNATNNSGQLFSCYASGQKDIAIYKYVTDFYTRPELSVGSYGTICLPYGSSNYIGAEFYEVAGKETGKVVLDQVTELEAGVPYIFKATANVLEVVYKGEAADASNKNGLYGTFTNNTPVDVGMYIVYDNQLRLCGTECIINANRAYLNLDEVDNGVPAQMPGRKRVGMAVTGENGTTDVDNIVTPNGKATKVLHNGQIIIIRNGEKFNAQGQKL